MAMDLFSSGKRKDKKPPKDVGSVHTASRDEKHLPDFSPPLDEPEAVPVRKETCQNCIYYEHVHCHRFPPVAAYDGFRFPQTKSEDWCGEHLEK